MKRSSLLFDLIKDLSSEELREAAQWLDCEVHNQRADLRRLFACYRSNTQEDGPAFWATLYPDTAFNDQNWRLLKSYLLERIEDWLSYRRWSSFRLPQVDPWLVEAYRERGLDRHLRNRLGRARRALAKQATPDLWTAYRLERQYFDLEAARRRLEAHNLHDRDQLLDAAVLRTKLRAACQTLSSLRLQQKDPDILLLEECLEIAAGAPYCDLPGVAPYRLACLMLLQPEEAEAEFLQLMELLSNKLNHYPVDEQRDLLRIGINHCVGRINKDDHSFLAPALALYRQAIDQKLHYEGGQLSTFTFNNVIGIALRLGEIDWAEAFLEQEAEFLPEVEREPLLGLNTARMALARQDYNGVLVALRSSEYRDFIHQMSARTLQLKAYWALELNFLLETHLRNTRAILRRKKDKSYHVVNFRNLFDLADQLLRLSPGATTARERLEKMINQTEPLPERDWLLSRLHHKA
ncbi:MAG: hypothetical protein AAF433_12695 [Bacteroidota bacterium]